MKINKPIIALSGNGRSGKDTLCRLIRCRYISNRITRYAFADALKLEVNKFLLDTMGISAFTEDPVEKEKIRPFLVFWGVDFRRKDNDNYWVDSVMASIDSNDDDASVVTDVRFMNEHTELKKHDTLFIYVELIDNDDKIIAPPANAYEEENNSILREKADYILRWRKNAAKPPMIPLTLQMILDKFILDFD